MSQSFWEIRSFHKQWDLIVVGAGITGCSAVLNVLKKHPDWQILMLERGFYPSGASTRNAGFACFGSVSELIDDLAHHPEDEIKDLVRRRYEGLELVRNTVPSRDLEFELCGGHELFTDPSDFARCADEIGRFNTWMKEISGEADVYEIRQVNGYPVIFNRLEGYLNSGKFIAWLHAKVIKNGVEIRWSSPVKRVETGEVHLESGEILQAKKVLLATNGFSENLVHDTGIVPARGYVFVTSPLPEMPWKGTWHYDKGFVYFRDLGNRLLIGGGRNKAIDTERTTRDEINPEIKEYLIDFTNRILNIESGWKIDYEWTGIMGFGTSKTPSCLKIKDGVWLAAGLGGMGVALGMQFGKEIARVFD